MAKKKEEVEEKKTTKKAAKKTATKKTTKKATKKEEKEVKEEKATKTKTTKKATKTKKAKEPKTAKKIKVEAETPEVVQLQVGKTGKPVLTEEAENVPEKRSRVGLIVGISVAVIFVAALILSIIQTNAAKQYFEEISYDEFTELYNGKEESLIWIASPTCSHCENMKPYVKMVSSQYKIKFNYLDVSVLDEQPYYELVGRLETDENFNSEEFGTPTLAVVKEGSTISTSIGEMDDTGIVEYLKATGLIK